MITTETMHMNAGIEAIEYDHYSPFREFKGKTSIYDLQLKGQLVRFIIEMNDVCTFHFKNEGVDISKAEEQVHIRGAISEIGLEILSRISVSRVPK